MIGCIDQAEGEQGDECLADGADGKGFPALPAEFAEIGAETDTGKGEQEGPSREVGEAGELRLGEGAKRGKQRDEQEGRG